MSAKGEDRDRAGVCVVEVAGEAGLGPRSDGRDTRARRRRSRYYRIIALPVQEDMEEVFP